MFQQNIDPYDLLIQLNDRTHNLEQYVRELQHNQLVLSNLLREQTALIQQLQHQSRFKDISEQFKPR
jgi:hypothetical protein